MLPLKAGSLTQSSPPVRSLEGMQDRDHIWPPFHSDWYLECILCFFLFPSPTVLRHPNLLLGLSMALHGYPSISTQAAGVWPGICQIHGSQRGNETVFDVRVGDSRPKRSEKCLVDVVYSTLHPSFLLWWLLVLLYQVRFWEPCHFDRAYCYILLFLWFRAEVLFEFTVEVTQERDMIEQWKKPDALVYIRELYYPVKYEDWGFNKPL